jgi:hypothetical protein
VMDDLCCTCCYSCVIAVSCTLSCNTHDCMMPSWHQGQTLIPFTPPRPLSAPCHSCLQIAGVLAVIVALL